jgi:predicted secreted protein
VLAIAALGVVASGASAKSVDQSSNGKKVSVDRGESLRIKLKPADSGSSGYHWRVAKAPGSILRLVSDKTKSGRQVFTYKARKTGSTSLKLQYVPPARGAKPTKTFRLTVKVKAPSA